MICPKLGQMESFETIAFFHVEDYELSAASTTASAAVASCNES